jgi:hypothetical protein
MLPFYPHYVNSLLCCVISDGPTHRSGDVSTVVHVHQLEDRLHVHLGYVGVVLLGEPAPAQLLHRVHHSLTTAVTTSF